VVRNTICLILVIAGLVAESPAFAAPIYEVTDLGVLPTGISSTATSVYKDSSTGHVMVGGYTTFADNTTQGFVWTDTGGMTAVGGTNSKVLGVSNGNAVGINANHPFRWTQSNGLVQLDGTNQGQANGVVASGEVAVSRVAGSAHRAILVNSSNTASNPYPGSKLTAVGLNDSLHFVGLNNGLGYFSTGSGPLTGLDIMPTSLSNSDLVAGAQAGIAAYENANTFAVTGIGTLSGDLTSNALGIDLLGTQIVGVSNGRGGFLYDIASATLSSLDGLLAPDASYWHILSANAVQQGFIAAQGADEGITHALLLTPVPVPEPSSLMLAVLAAVGGFLLRVGCRRASRVAMCAALFVGSLAANPAFAAPIYEVTDLGVLPGGVFSMATSVDATGFAGGYTTFSGGTTQGFIWTQDGGMVSVGGSNRKV